jgi:glucose-6-phosphate dehydrogenase assembly protein OpcA
VVTREERRALRAIEEALEAEDPRLAALLREPPALRSARLSRRLRLSAATIAVTLIILSLLLSSPGFLLAGVATLVLAFPAIRWWTATSPGPGDT